MAVEGPLKLLRDVLMGMVIDIDSGHSNGTEEDMNAIIEAIQAHTHKDEYYTKYPACKYLGVSRAAFDNLVREGKLPRGEKLYAGDNNLFWKVTDLVEYKNRKKKSS